MKSQDILRHGFDAVERVRKSQEDNLSVWPEVKKTCLFVKSVFVLSQSRAIYFKCFNFCFEGCYFLKAQRGRRLKHMNNFTQASSPD